MKKSKLVAATAMVSITGLAGSALAALPANAATHSSPRSLATVLTSDGNKFDKNGKRKSKPRPRHKRSRPSKKPRLLPWRRFGPPTLKLAAPTGESCTCVTI